MSRSVSSRSQGAADLLDLDAKPGGNEMNRCLPGHFDEPRRLQHGFEVQRAGKTHAVDHDVGHRVVVVERDFADRQCANLLGLSAHQQRKLIGGKSGEDARGIERRASGMGGGLELVTPLGGEVGRRIDQAGGRRRHDIDPRRKQPQVVRDRAGVTLRTTRGIHNAIGLERNERVRIVGGGSVR